MSDLPTLPGINMLGKSYNVNGKYADPISAVLPLFDFGTDTKVITVPSGEQYLIPSDIAIQFIPIGRSHYETFAGKSIEAYRTELNVYTNLQGSYKFFTGSLETSFNKEEMGCSENEFVAIRNVIESWVVNLPDPQTMISRLLPQVKDDLENMDPLALLKKYGAYFIWEAIVGGRVDYSAATDSMTFSRNYELGVSAKMSYETLIGSISASNKTRYAKAIESFRSSSTVEVSTIGGDPALGAAIQSGGKDAFNQWAASVTKKPGPTLSDFSGDSLRPIWELVNDKSRAQQIIDVYPQYMAEYQKDIPQTDPIIAVFNQDEMILAGADHGSGAHNDVSVYKPAISGGWSWLGQYAQGNYDTPSGSALIAKAITPGALAAPISFERVWDDHGSGNDHDYSLWKPIPPVGYKALGYLMRLRVDNQNPPSGDEIEGLMCVHESLVTQATVNTSGSIWNDAGSGADWDGSIWTIIPTDDQTALKTGTFYGERSHATPETISPPVYCILKDKIQISATM